MSLAAPEENISALKNHAEIIQAGEVTVDLPVLLTKLAEKGIKRLMVEGGGTLIWGMLSAGLVDELTMFVGNIIIGGKDAPTLADGTGYVLESDFPVLERMDVIPMEEGVLIHWKVRK